MYNGAPILAVFHSSSAGMTRSSGEVWTSDLPYLQSVEAMEDPETVPNYYSTAEFTAQEFKERFLAKHPEADLSGDVSGWIGTITRSEAMTILGRILPQGYPRSEANNVDTITVGGVSVRGTELRSILSLRSASFDVEVKNGKLIFYVTGFGHGVGLSQYGANEMAQEGKTYLDILNHYYTGVTITTYVPKLAR